MPRRQSSTDQNRMTSVPVLNRYMRPIALSGSSEGLPLSKMMRRRDGSGNTVQPNGGIVHPSTGGCQWLTKHRKK